MNPSEDGVALFGLKVLPIAMLLTLAPVQIFAQVHQTSLEFPGGYPTAGTAQRFYDEADLNRAIEAYRFFYPNVSMLGMLRGMEEVGAKENRSFLIFEARPSGVLFTPNSDTPYATDCPAASHVSGSCPKVTTTGQDLPCAQYFSRMMRA